MAETQNMDIQITIENLVVDADNYIQENVRKELMAKLIGYIRSYNNLLERNARDCRCDRRTFCAYSR